jgi:hypothetical protein
MNYPNITVQFSGYSASSYSLVYVPNNDPHFFIWNYSTGFSPGDTNITYETSDDPSNIESVLGSEFSRGTDAFSIVDYSGSFLSHLSGTINIFSPPDIQALSAVITGLPTQAAINPTPTTNHKDVSTNLQTLTWEYP